MFIKIFKKYLFYFLCEIRFEFVGYLSDLEIDDSFFFLCLLKKRGFILYLIKEKFEELKLGDGILMFNKILSCLFKVGVIGNVFRRFKIDGGDVYLWLFNDEDLEMDLMLNFEIYCGLWDVLGIIKFKFR